MKEISQKIECHEITSQAVSEELIILRSFHNPVFYPWHFRVLNLIYQLNYNKIRGITTQRAQNNYKDEYHDAIVLI